MSILTVKNISHGFGDRAIFEDDWKRSKNLRSDLID